jgi:hypothetical protein
MQCAVSSNQLREADIEPLPTFHMAKTQPGTDFLWVRTDPGGQIQDLSSSASELLGLSRARGENLFMFFPLHSREMAFDMEVALTGWPSRRVATLESAASRRLAVRYTVSTGVALDSVGLYWFFDVVGAERQLFH